MKLTVKQKINSLFLILFFCVSLSYSQGINNAQIRGTIISATVKTIRIGENTIPISETGEFTFTAKIKYPMLYDISYGKLNWVVYLEPNSKTELKLNSGDLSSLEYKGDLTSPNNFLKKTSLLNQPVNDSFYNLKNIVQLVKKDEANYISAIDSLRNFYLKPLSSVEEGNEKLSKAFIELFKADVNFKVYNLILVYPLRHWWIGTAHERVILSKSGLDYINPKTIDNIEWLDLSSYREFCKSWIDYNADILAIKNTGQKNYSLKKMDVVFGYLPKRLTNHELLDYWLSECLSDFIQKNGMANSEKYVKDFYANCKTEVYRARIENQCSSILQGQKDHIVKIYKSINGYNLTAHIFYPNEFKKGEKRPAILVFFGGGWDDGNVMWAFGNAKQYSNLGMIGIAVQYRLSNHKDITPIDAMQDTKDLMIWLRINADSLGIVSDKIAGSGWSAGGHLIASAAVFADTLHDKEINSAPDVLLLTSPALDVGHEVPFNLLLSETGVDPLSLSPVEHVFKGLPPTIIFQGREDHVVPLKGVQLFHDKMVANGNYCELCIYDNVGHLFTPSYLDDRGWPHPDKEIQKQADIKAVEFLKKFGFISK
ncbi:MAG: alpha/beta hydrolase [Bacteroidota bacterium]|jgi:acetyl esterase/lipase